MTRILIVGAGPAGIRAAQTLVAAGLRPLVVDEGARAGGQIYRRPPVGFVRPPKALYGREAAKARDLHDCFDGLVTSGAIDYSPRSSVIALKDGLAWVAREGRVERVSHDGLILATGAMDRVAPVPGWEAPGVYTLGAAQIALKAQGVALGRRIVLAGSGPLLTLVAHQLRKAGAEVVAVLESTPVTRQLRGVPGMMARPRILARGMVMRLGLGRRYHAGATIERVEADDKGVTAVIWRDRRGRSHTLACDMVALGWHLRAETHLADLAGVPFDHDHQWGQWLPRVDRMGRARPGVYLAGDGVRVLGADGAEITGRWAARACLADLGLPVGAERDEQRRLGVMERFARGVARAFPWPSDHVAALPDGAIVCRCEGITVADLKAAVDLGGAEANRTKSLSRVGMGRCQGRYCHRSGTEIIAKMAGVPVAEVGRLRSQSPARPVPLGDYVGEDEPE